MLTLVKIENVRSCVDVQLSDLGQMTVLVGRNGAGKTNIMRAIDFAAKNAVLQKSFDDLSTVFEFWPAPRDMRIRLEFALENQSFAYTLAFSPSQNALTSPREAPTAFETLEVREGDMLGSEWRSILLRKGEAVFRGDRPTEAIAIGPTVPCLTAMSSLLPQDDPLLKTIQPIVGFLGKIHYYPLDELNLLRQGLGTQIVRHADYAKWLQTRNAGDSSSVLMRLIHMHLDMPDEFQHLEELLGDNGLGILHQIDVDPFNMSNLTTPQQPTRPSDKGDIIYFVNFMPTFSNDEPSFRRYDQVSFGTRRLLRILASVIHDRGLVTLMEQPEDGIHPGLLHKLIPMLKTNADGQIILASHSPAVFNRLRPEEIRLVAMRNGETYVRALSADEVEGARRFISEEGALSDFIESIEED